jgi:hypothetical protein
MSPRPPTPVSSIIANVVTGESIVLGTVELPAAHLPSAASGRATYHFQFLELLNNPRLASVQKGVIRESLVLTDVCILPRTGPRIPVARELLVRPESIVCAYEYEGQGQARAVDYDPGLYHRPEKVVIITTNGLRLEGTFLGGVGVLSAPRQKRFLPLVDATLGHTDEPGTRLPIPFIAVNHDAIAAFTQGG